MTRLLLFGLAIALGPAGAAQDPAVAPPPAAAATPAPRTNLPKKKDRYGWMGLLRGDVSLALDRNSVDNKLRRTLQKDMDVLRQAVDAHQNRRKFDENKINATLVSINNSFSNRMFREEDRAHVMEDLDNLPMKEVKPKQPRRNPRMGPRPRRYPPF